MQFSLLQQALRVLFIYASLPSIALGQSYQELAAVELMNTSVSSTKSGLITLPPNCWISAMQSFHPHSFQQNGGIYASEGTKFCAALGNSEQQFLALALTNCHLSSAGRPTTETCHTSINMGNNYSYDMPTCLSTLNGFDFSVYTQFYLYVNEICQRLTDSLVIQQKLEASFLFERRAIEMEMNINNVLDRLSGMSSHFDAAHSLLNEFSRLKAVVGNVLPSLHHQIVTLNPIILSTAAALWFYTMILFTFIGIVLFAKIFVPPRFRIKFRRFVMAVVSICYVIQLLLGKVCGMTHQVLGFTTKDFENLKSSLYASIAIILFFFFFLRRPSSKDRNDNGGVILNNSSPILERNTRELEEKMRKIEEKILWDAECRRREHDQLLWQLSLTLDRHLQHSSMTMSSLQSNPSVTVPFVSPQRVHPPQQVTWEMIKNSDEIVHYEAPEFEIFTPGIKGTSAPRVLKRSHEEALIELETNDAEEMPLPTKKLKSSIQKVQIY